MQHRQDLLVEGINDTVGTGDDGRLAALTVMNIIDVATTASLLSRS